MQSVDLLHGVIPISKAASSLAQLFQFANRADAPVIITQKGMASGVLLTIEQFTTLRNQAMHAEQSSFEPEAIADVPVEES